jgi:hypothetical protein
MKNILRLTIALTALAFSFPGLRAEGTAPAAPATPAATEPLLTISLPANLKAEDVASAIMKAFNTHKWVGVTAENDKIVATHSQGGVSVKATAVCSAAEVKLFADYKVEGKTTPEKGRAVVLRWFHIIEKNAKEELGLLPKKAEKKKKAE